VVRGGVILVLRDSLGALIPDSIRQRYAYTIPALFLLIRREIASEQFSVTAKFDQSTGYPTRVSVENVELWDAGYRLDISEVRPLVGAP
jgi:hypothetical protein